MPQPPRRPELKTGRHTPVSPIRQGRGRNWLVLILLALVLTMVFSSIGQRGTLNVSYTELKDHIRAGEVAEVIVSAGYVEAIPTEEAAPESVKRWRAVRVQADEELVRLVENQGINLWAKEESACSSGLIWFWVLPLVFLFFFWSMMMRRMGGSGPGTQALTFGKARFKLYMEEGTGVGFDDVAGCEEEKKELEEVIEFLQEADRFYRLGARIPKGVLLVGPPGTGKTLLARAVAGEANVPFFNINGSDFVEMFVGVGAARVRDLFDQAQKIAPCIIFIDELDAVGKARGAGGPMGGNDEREQTLNALLVEMDGFAANSGVIILAATNRPEILDPALLRPGRFDRQVAVDRPDIRGREAILRVHAKELVLGAVDLEKIAAQTPGFVGADLANVVNEAALMAARRRQESVEQADFDDAILRVVAGLEKRNRRMNQQEKRIVAYHESGHAIAAAALPNSDPVQKVSIIPRGIGALGFTLQVPLEDRYLMTRQELLDKVGGLLGGRAAETVVFGDISTGAQNDLMRCTDIARRMITEYGMSRELGSVHLGDGGREGNLAAQLSGARNYSETTAERIDEEVREIIDTMMAKAIQILEENRTVLEDMAQMLLRDEVIEGPELDDLLARVERTEEDRHRTAVATGIDASTGTVESDSLVDS